MTDLLSHGVEAEVYQPEPLWMPAIVPDELAAATEAFRTTKDVKAEIRLAGLLGASVLTFYSIMEGDGGSGIYRAGKALELGIGNCMASTEIAAGLVQKLDLEALVVWRRVPSAAYEHASLLWRGKRIVWEIDPFFFKAKPWGDNPNTNQELQGIADQLFQQGRGAYIWEPGIEDGTVEWAHLPAQLDQARLPQHDGKGVNYTLLGPVQGIRMLGAMGDLERYRQHSPERYAKLAGQIMQHIPQGLLSVQ